MNKKAYEKPELTVITVQTADIITTSTDPFDGEKVSFGFMGDDQSQF